MTIKCSWKVLLVIVLILLCISATLRFALGKKPLFISESERIFEVCLNPTYRCINSKREVKDMKYILQWTPAECSGWPHYFIEGQCGFEDNGCEFTNCFFTSKKNYFKDVTKFDAIIFSGHENSVPRKRSPRQLYIFSIKEAADTHPVCWSKFDNFFNWTWTYKLDSDVHWGYIEIQDTNGMIIGPKKEMHWMKLQDMAPVPQALKAKLKKKHKLVAWFASKCVTGSRREVFVKALGEELKASGYRIDIYGKCGTKVCERMKPYDRCDYLIDRDYYFYLAFENCFSEDYVTEKLLRALNHNAIPVVYGGANYTRFMPDGIYLNARELGVKKLANKMVSLVKNFSEYLEYFKWKSHYTYEESEKNDYCRFCAALNNKTLTEKPSLRSNFIKWWNIPNRCREILAMLSKSKVSKKG